MTRERQIGLAIGGSVVGHLLLAGGAMTILAFSRASPPPNDAFDDARVLRSRWEVSGRGDNLYATREFGEAAHAGTVEGGSVWWRWKAPDACSVEVLVDGREFEEVAAVYRGAVLDTLSEVASRGAEEGGALRFVAEPGTQYHIAVAGSRNGESGAISIQIHADPETDPEDPEELVLLLPDLFTFEEVREEPPAEKDKTFLRTEDSEAAERAPERPRFESDRNTVAASELPAAPEGEEGMITQEGEEFPWAELAAGEFNDGESEADTILQVAPQWAPEEKRSKLTEGGFSEVPRIDVVTPASAAESEVPSAFDERAEDPDSAFAASKVAKENVAGDRSEIPSAAPPKEDDDGRPVASGVVVPAPAEVVPKPEPSTKFEPNAVKRRTVGTLTQRGASALDAADTPLGRYQKQIDDAVQRSWQRARSARGEFDTLGSLKVRFWVNREGRIVNLKVLSQDAPKDVVEFSVATIRTIEIPPMPDEIYRQTRDGLLDMDYIIIY